MISTLIDSLFGCSHKRITFPITVKHTHTRKDDGPTGTYVVCLDCGEEFAYDWKEMKIVGRREHEVVLTHAAAVKAA